MADPTLVVNIGVVDFGDESDFGWFVGIAGGEPQR